MNRQGFGAPGAVLGRFDRSTRERFHTPGADGVPYATLAINGHLETWPLHSRLFRHFLERRAYQATGKLPSAHAIHAALGVLTGAALFDGPERHVFTRLAEHHETVYLDLGDPTWRAVEITRSAWRVVAPYAVKFRRARGMLALPVPIPGGALDDLRPFLNVADEGDYRLLVTWLLAALRPCGPYPSSSCTANKGPRRVRRPACCAGCATRIPRRCARRREACATS